MSRRPAVLLVAVLVGAGLLVAAHQGAVLAQEEGTVVGQPDLALSVQQDHLTWGEQLLNVSVSNGGTLSRGGPAAYEERVQTARNVRLEIATDRLAPRLARALQVKSGPVLAGSIPPGTAGPFPFRIELNETLAPGTYEVPIRVSYDYTGYVEYGPRRAPTYGERSRTTVETVSVVVEDRARFSLAAEPGSVPAGDSGPYRFTVTNTGTQPAADATVVLATANASLYFGDPTRPRQTQTVFLRRLAPGESRTVAVSVGATRATRPGTYPVSAVVHYRTPNGVRRASDPLSFGVAVTERQQFAVSNVTASVQADGSGTVRGVVTNRGPDAVTDGAVAFEANGSTLRPRNPVYAVGGLGPGESAPFAFTVDAANGTRPGPQQVGFRVRYRNPAGDLRTSDRLPARVDVGARQTFAVRDVTGDLRVGATGRVRGTVVNAGNETVTDAVVVFRGGAGGLSPRNTEYAVGTLRPGERTTFSFQVDVANGTDPGPRQLSLRVRYRDEADQTRTSDPLAAPVVVGERQAFAVRNVTDSVRVGGSGVVRGVVVNTGDATVSNAVVLLDVGTDTLAPRNSAYAVGTLEPGDSVPFSFRVDASNRTESGPRQVGLRVRYRDETDETRTSEALQVPVSVAREQTFAVRNVTSTLRVGRRGTVRGVVVNTGERPVRDAVVDFQPDSRGLAPRETEYAVGNLGPGESAPFAFTVDASNRTDAGPRPVTFRVSYRDEADEQAASDALAAQVRVAPQMDAFQVEPVNATVAADGDTVLVVQVTNRLDQPVRDLRATMTVTEPFETDDPTSFVSSLGPNESALVRFDLGTTADAIPKNDSVSLTFGYTDAAGERLTSEPYLVPVTVVPRPGGPIPVIPAVAVAVVLALAVGWWWLRR